MSHDSSHTLSVDFTHPSLPGHFPGKPVVPGVVVISFILGELRRQLPVLEVVGVRKLKFLHMLLPQQPFNVEFATPEANSLRFKCWRGAQNTAAIKRELLVEGHLLLRNEASYQDRAAS